MQSLRKTQTRITSLLITFMLLKLIGNKWMPENNLIKIKEKVSKVSQKLRSLSQHQSNLNEDDVNENENLKEVSTPFVF